VAVTPAIGTPDLCRQCHEFRIPAWHDGVLTVTEVPMQSTWTEWAAWRDAGGVEICQDCHMPGGRHLFRGAHDTAVLEGSVRVEGNARGCTVASVGTARSLRPGVGVRQGTLEVAEATGWVVISWFGRRFEPALVDGRVQLELAGDTSLQPGVPVEIPYAGRATAWRLRYHYTAEDLPARTLANGPQLP
jgi:hypothetical protein